MRYRISEIQEPSSGTKVFRLLPLDGPNLKYVPGQFVFLHVLDKAGNTVAKNPYSLASSPDEPCLELCIKMRHGHLTSMLESIQSGAVVGIEGPFGHFGYEGEGQAAFVAGGAGIAPFIGMLRYIAGRGLKGRFVLFYSAKNKDCLTYGKELEALAKKNPDIRLIITLTRETPGDWKGECGRINRQMIVKHIGKPADFRWWICGPLEMVAGVKSCLTESGVDPGLIKMEGWG